MMLSGSAWCNRDAFDMLWSIILLLYPPQTKFIVDYIYRGVYRNHPVQQCLSVCPWTLQEQFLKDLMDFNEISYTHNTVMSS